MSSKRIIKQTNGGRLPSKLSMRRRHVTLHTDDENFAASETEDYTEIYHPVVTKKKKLMNLTHNLQSDRPQSKRAVTMNANEDVRPEFLIIRESQGPEVIGERHKPRTQLIGETSGMRSLGRETFVPKPEITMEERSVLPETWGGDDETPTQPSESSETLHVYATASPTRLTPSDVKETSGESTDVTPVEEYITVVEGIINKGLLSPRSTEVLRKNVNKYKFVQKGSRIDETPEIPVLDSSEETQRDTSLSDSQKDTVDFTGIFSIESDQELPAERAASVILLESRDDASALTETVEKHGKPEILTKESYRASGSAVSGGSMFSDESISDTSSVSVRKEEDTENDRYEMHSGLARTFQETLKESCNLDSFAIENPFSDFSLHNLRHDKLLKERLFRSQRDIDSFVSADSEPCSDRQNGSTSTSIYYDSVACDEDFYRQQYPSTSAQDTREIPGKSNEKKYGASRKVAGKMDSIEEETAFESTDDEIDVEVKFADRFKPDDSDSLAEIVRDLTQEYENKPREFKSVDIRQNVKDDAVKRSTQNVKTEKVGDVDASVSKKKKCTKCGMSMVKGKEDMSSKSLTKEKSSTTSGTSKTETDRKKTKKATGTCKCGCVKPATKNENSGQSGHKSIINRISHYFLPLLADFMVPRQLVALAMQIAL